ncbi:MAG TPA: SMI1/KNR4 family protein [Kofleriaceae bacterium]|nr:SMI1/KNR4 family protein [Kofleriaceae bacterium]
MERRGPAVHESDVAAFEGRLGHRLPDDYRRFLLEVNGGRPDDTSCQYKFGVINQFFSLNDPHTGRDLTAANKRPAIPSRQLLYVGVDGMGTRFLVALAGDQRGQVWIQDMANPRPDDANPRVLWHDRRDLEKLADSFEELMRTLGPLQQ